MPTRASKSRAGSRRGTKVTTGVRSSRQTEGTVDAEPRAAQPKVNPMPLHALWFDIPTGVRLSLKAPTPTSRLADLVSLLRRIDLPTSGISGWTADAIAGGGIVVRVPDTAQNITHFAEFELSLAPALLDDPAENAAYLTCWSVACSSDRREHLHPTVVEAARGRAAAMLVGAIDNALAGPHGMSATIERQ